MPQPVSPRCALCARLCILGLLCAGALKLAGCAAAPRAAPPSPASADASGAQGNAQPTSTAQGPTGANALSGPTMPAVRPMVLATDANSQTLLASAAAAFARRTDVAQLELAIAQWERVHGLEPERAAVALSLSRAYFLLGDSFYRSAPDAASGNMQDAFERGALAGEQALMLLSPAFAAKLNQGQPVEEALLACDKGALEAMVYYGQNLAAFAVARGLSTMILYRSRLQTLVEQIIVRDESAVYGAAYRIRGAFMAAAPSFAGGSLPQAQAAFLRAQMLAPDYLPNALALAENWAVLAADKRTFVQTLNQVASANAQKPIEVSPEQILAQKRAAWLLDRVNLLF